MARQTYFTSATKRPRSLRQILAELFSGRVLSRLDELETTVRLLNERLDKQASVVANVGGDCYLWFFTPSEKCTAFSEGEKQQGQFEWKIFKERG